MKGEVEQWDDWLVIKTNPYQDLSWDKTPAKWLANWGRKFLSEDDEGCPYHIDSKFHVCDSCIKLGYWSRGIKEKRIITEGKIPHRKRERRK